jgi:hypothetical protein
MLNVLLIAGFTDIEIYGAADEKKPGTKLT